jgi:hypothetical protein
VDIPCFLASGHVAKICPDLIIVRLRMQHYIDVSLKITEIYNEYTDLVEVAILNGSPNRERLPLISRNCSSMLKTSTKSVYSL